MGWIPLNNLTSVEIEDIKKLKSDRNSSGILKMLLLTEKNLTETLITSKDIPQMHRAQGIAQFLKELSEIINM